VPDRIAENQLTLEPYGSDDLGLPRLNGIDQRRVLTFTGQAPALVDDWTPAVLDDGRTIEVRRGDCGAGCRCGGEYRG